MFTDKVTNPREAVELTGPEAALALGLLVGFTDDSISEEEAGVIKSYYRPETVSSLEEKAISSGLNVPTQIEALRDDILRQLEQEPQEFKVRTIAVTQLLMLADGVADREEMKTLSEFASLLGISLAEAEAFAETRLLEIDEKGDYYRFRPSGGGGTIMNLDLSPGEASLLVSTMVAFADGNVSDQEAALLRDHLDPQCAESLEKKCTNGGVTYPGEVALLAPSVPSILAPFSRDSQLRILGLAWKVAQADGEISSEELAVMKSWCEELAIGLEEVKTCFKALGSVV